MALAELPHHHGGDTERLRGNLGQVGNFQTVAEVFRLLGDTTRVRIFWLLCHCEECVINISAMMEMSSPAVSHHLRALKSSGLIVSRRDGKEVYYRAADTEEAQLLHRMIERVMEITCPEVPHTEASGLNEIVRQVHQRLTQDMQKRATIDELSREFHVNPTTLKEAFKAVYGTSIAAHIREHRMEEAARLLRESDVSVAGAARAVGYDSQSRFAAAFREHFGVLPKEYRKKQ